MQLLGSVIEERDTTFLPLPHPAELNVDLDLRGGT